MAHGRSLINACWIKKQKWFSNSEEDDNPLIKLEGKVEFKDVRNENHRNIYFSIYYILGTLLCTSYELFNPQQLHEIGTIIINIIISV